MTVYYVDYQNGNDSNDGLTFANRKKSVYSASLASSSGDEIRVMASPDPTLVGAGIVTDRPGMNSSILLGTGAISYSTTTGSTQITSADHGFSDGDTIGIYGNTNGREIDGTWEISNVTTNTFTLDGYTGNANTTGSGGRILNLTQKRILLDTAVTQNIASYGPRTTAWTASANVTAALESQTSDTSNDGRYTEHSYGDRIVIAAGFTTGKAAYYTLPSTLDLSGYQQISLRVKQYAGSRNTSPDYSNVSLRLCTDSTGDTSVHTIELPIRATSGTATYFVPITKDFGTNLNSGINSVALYVDTDLGAQSFRICNIIACKASSSNDSLTLNSLIGLNSTTNLSNQEWYTIESINDRRILLTVGDPIYQPKSTNYGGGHGAWFGNNAGSNNIYKRETIVFETTSSSSAHPFTALRTAKSASFGSETTISGGWNRTDMTTQTGMTYIDSGIYFGIGLFCPDSYISFSNFGFVRFNSNQTSNSNGLQFENMDFIENNLSFYTNGGSVSKLNNVKVIANGFNFSGGAVINSGGWSATDGDLTIIGFTNTGYYGNSSSSRAQLGRFNAYQGDGSTATVNLSSGIFECEYVYISPGSGAMTSGIALQSTSQNTLIGAQTEYPLNQNMKIGICTVSNMRTGIKANNGTNIQVREYNYTTGRSTFSSYYGNVTSPAPYSIDSDDTSRVYVTQGGTVSRAVRIGDGHIYLNNVQIDSSPEDLYYGAGNLYSKNHDGVSGEFYNVLASAYDVTPDTTTRHTASGYSWKIQCTNQNYDAEFMIAKVAASASTSITFKIWCYRTNTGFDAKLKVLGNGSIDGITSDTYSSGLSGSTLTWEETSLTITPSSDCVVEVFLFLTSTSTAIMYVDDFSIT